MVYNAICGRNGGFDGVEAVISADVAVIVFDFEDIGVEERGEM